MFCPVGSESGGVGVQGLRRRQVPALRPCCSLLRVALGMWASGELPFCKTAALSGGCRPTQGWQARVLFRVPWPMSAFSGCQWEWGRGRWQQNSHGISACAALTRPGRALVCTSMSVHVLHRMSPRLPCGHEHACPCATPCPPSPTPELQEPGPPHRSLGPSGGWRVSELWVTVVCA